MFSVEKVYEFLDRIKITEDDNTVEKDCKLVLINFL